MKQIYTLLLLFTALAALPQSGTLDATFGNNGKVHTGFGFNDSMANAVAVQPDGKIIVGGSAYTANTVNSWEIDTQNSVLVRYNADGTQDASFGNAGIVMNDYYTVSHSQGWRSEVLNIKVLDGGKILTYGGAYLGYGGRTDLVRYNSDGSLDTTFGSSGHVICNDSASPITGANSLLIQPDGKILVLSVQNLQPTPGVYTSNFLIERYSPDGILDTTFGTAGTTITAFGSGYNVPRAMALQPDGKIIAVGASYNNLFGIARYTANGQLDTSFDGDGKATTSFGAGTKAWPNYVAVRPDGKIVVAGTSANTTSPVVTNFAVARYNASGGLDTSFDTDGKATNPFPAGDLSVIVTSFLQQPDGKFVVTTTESPNSYTYGMVENFTTRRFNPDATPDASFGTNGIVSTACQEGYNRAKMATLQTDGKIIVAGFSHPSLSERNEFSVTRYESNGILDNLFASGGNAFASFDSSNDELVALLQQPDGKLIAIGTKRNSFQNGFVSKDMVLSRYNGDGSLDSSFGVSGKTVSVFGTSLNTVSHAILQPDGKIVLANMYYSFNGDTYHYELVRYTASGNIDAAFGTDGKVTLDAEATSLLSQPDGKIIATFIGSDAQNNSFLIVKRFNNDGSADAGFSASVAGTFYSSVGTFAALQPDGKIVVTTSMPNSSNSAVGFATFRFNADGSLDTGFSSPVTTSDTVLNAKAVFIEPDGKIVVAGRSMAYDGLELYYFVAARYNQDGSLDTAYGTNGIRKSFLGTFYTPYNMVQSVVLQPDGKFLVALTKPDLNPANPNPNSFDFTIARFDANGDLDNSFNYSGQVTTQFYTKYDEAFAMLLQPDSKIVVAGTTDTGVNRNFALARYENELELAVDEHMLGADVVVYPNPVRDVLHLKTSNGNEILDYCIYNLLGQAVHQGSGDHLEVNTAGFANGIYSVVIQTRNGSVFSKFVKGN